MRRAIHRRQVEEEGILDEAKGKAREAVDKARDAIHRRPLAIRSRRPPRGLQGVRRGPPCASNKERSPALIVKPTAPA